MIPMSILPVNTGDLQVEPLIHGPTAKKGRGAGSRHPAWGRPSTACKMGRHRPVVRAPAQVAFWSLPHSAATRPRPRGSRAARQHLGTCPQAPTWPGKDANQESLPPSPSGRSSHLHSPSKCNLRHQIKATTWVLQLNNGSPERNCIKEKQNKTDICFCSFINTPQAPAWRDPGPLPRALRGGTPCPFLPSCRPHGCVTFGGGKKTTEFTCAFPGTHTRALACALFPVCCTPLGAGEVGTTFAPVWGGVCTAGPQFSRQVQVASHRPAFRFYNGKEHVTLKAHLTH